MPHDLIQSLVQFGVAGLMGILWVWERQYSRLRERQLTQTHDKLAAERQHLKVLAAMVQQNTRALERFEHTQSRLLAVLEADARLRRTRDTPPCPNEHAR